MKVYPVREGRTKCAGISGKFSAQRKEFSFALTSSVRERAKRARPRSSCFEKAARLITVCEMFFKLNVNGKVLTLRKKLKQKH